MPVASVVTHYPKISKSPSKSCFLV